MKNDQSEKPEQLHKNFSIVVPISLYKRLRLLSVQNDTSLGAVCRELLQDAVNIRQSRKTGTK